MPPPNALLIPRRPARALSRDPEMIRRRRHLHGSRWHPRLFGLLSYASGRQVEASLAGSGSQCRARGWAMRLAAKDRASDQQHPARSGALDLVAPLARSTTLKPSLFGAVRRRTMICWRSTIFSASTVALDRNNPISSDQINLQPSHIGWEHRPIRLPRQRMRFTIGTAFPW